MTNNTKRKLKTISHMKDTKNYNQLTKQEKQKLEEILKRHPMRIPDYYYNLINWNDEFDPIKKMTIPEIYEINAEGDYDTSKEASNTKLPGLQHKYQKTVLVLSTNTCFMYCRYCFRKRMVGYSKAEISKRMNKTIDYVKKHHEVNNVLISGGDSFTMTNKMIEKYLKYLTEIEHLDFIRFGTRSLVVKPDRIYKDEALLEILSRYNQKKEIIIVTHFNHPREITEETKKATLALKNAGCSIRNQTVILKGINDNPKTMAELLNKLTSLGIHPYYVFQCRPVKGVTHFQVPISKGIDILNLAKKDLNGISKAFRYIMSHPRGKIEIIDKTDSEFIFKFHQNKYKEDENRFFTKKINESARWLDLELDPISG
ncbi:MAG: KamA family radical SAM protein [Tenericutes bacterium]|jgi:lysine 2,3-aminomutase|nr:KamA family radical SAM protein [Mycoplasmatota bacterium]